MSVGAGIAVAGVWIFAGLIGMNTPGLARWVLILIASIASAVFLAI
jgi:hypothetical protein